MNQFTPTGNYAAVRNQRAMHRNRFESKEALVAHAEQNGLTCFLESSFAKWKGRLSPEQYDVVDVQTSSGLRPAIAESGPESGLAGVIRYARRWCSTPMG